MEVLPALEKIFVDGFRQSGPLREAFGQFVASRQLPGHHILISPGTEDRDDARHISCSNY